MAAYAAALATKGTPMRHEEIHKVVGCGSLVAVLSAMSIGNREMAVIDLWRVEGDLIVDHWNVAEEILPEDQWANSGRF